MRNQWALMMVLLLGCSKDKGSFNATEETRRQARENALQLAQEFRASHQAYANYDIEANGDSTISPSCPQGGGWVTQVFRPKMGQGGGSIKIKCSSYSAGKGCLTEDEFETTTWAKEDGKCSSEVPFPLPKLAH